MMAMESMIGKGAPEALEVTEAARETSWRYPSLVGELFMGRLRKDLVSPYPEQDPEDRQRGDAFLEKLRLFSRNLTEALDFPRQTITGPFSF
ncbi:MAG: hypothetical protein HYU33_06935 [Candidatus Omnitrophica bacterium]|nr:hypothetical protein [Candidatus Omnitrophota bacterium]